MKVRSNNCNNATNNESLVREETSTYTTGCSHSGAHDDTWIRCSKRNCDVWHCWKDINIHFELCDEDGYSEIRDRIFQSNHIFKCIKHGFKTMHIVSSASKKSLHDSDDEYVPPSRNRNRNKNKKSKINKKNCDVLPKSFNNSNRNHSFESFNNHEANIDFEKLYLSKLEILSVSPEQLIDHKRIDGKWCQAKVTTIVAKNNYFVIEYLETKQNVVVRTEHDSNFIHKFALFGSISKRQSMKLTEEFPLGYDKFQVNGKQCRIIGIDDTSGQLKVKSIFNGEEFWIHPDDEKNVKILKMCGLSKNEYNPSQSQRKVIEPIVISSDDDEVPANRQIFCGLETDNTNNNLAPIQRKRKREHVNPINVQTTQVMAKNINNNLAPIQRKRKREHVNPINVLTTQVMAKNINNNCSEEQRKINKDIIVSIDLISSDDETVDEEIESCPAIKRRKINESESKNPKIENEKKMDYGNNGKIKIKQEYKNNNILRKHYTQWTAEELISWLTELENGKFKKYSFLLGKLHEEEVSGADLQNITEEHLKRWGIKKFADKVAICKHIQDLIKMC